MICTYVVTLFFMCYCVVLSITHYLQFITIICFVTVVGYLIQFYCDFFVIYAFFSWNLIIIDSNNYYYNYNYDAR